MSSEGNTGKRDMVVRYTAYRIHKLNEIRETGAGKAELARLRQGVGRAPGDLPLLWGSFLADMPEELYASSFAEWAVYTSITLYALHQQGNHDKCMHQADTGLGNAMAQLVEDENDLDRITRRFNIVATSSDKKAMAYNLRGVVQLLKANDIVLDYAQLAGDLFRFQFHEGAENVRLKWGRDFYRVINRNKKGKDDNNEYT